MHGLFEAYSKKVVGKTAGLEDQAALIKESFSNGGILNNSSSDFCLNVCYDSCGKQLGVELFSKSEGVSLISDYSAGSCLINGMDSSVALKLEYEVYNTVSKSFTSTEITQAIESSKVYLNNEGVVTGRSFAGTSLEGIVEDCIPANCSYKMNSLRHTTLLNDARLSNANISEFYGASVDGLSGLDLIKAKDFMSDVLEISEMKEIKSIESLTQKADEVLSIIGKDSIEYKNYTFTKGAQITETLEDGTKVIIEQTDMVTAADAEKAGYTAVESTNGTVYTKEKDGFVRIFKPDTVEDGIGAVLILASTALVVNEVYNDCQQENYKDASKELMSYSGSLLGSTIIAEAASVMGFASAPALVLFAAAVAGGYIGNWIGNQIADDLYDAMVIETHNGYTCSIFERKYSFMGCISNIIEAKSIANGNKEVYLSFIQSYFPNQVDTYEDLRSFYLSIMDGYWDYLSDDKFYNDLSNFELSRLNDFYEIINAERGKNSDFDSSLDTMSVLLKNASDALWCSMVDFEIVNNT